MYDIAIIGAGVTGAAAARELSRFDLKIAVLDKENDVCAGTSKANSGIIHAGFDPEEGTLMAKLNAEGNTMFDALCEELGVPFKRNGSLVAAFDDGQLAHIERLKRRGTGNGIRGLAILSGDEVLSREPAINPGVKGALFAPSAGIIDPMLLTISMMENAVMNGAVFYPGFNVKSIKSENGGYVIASQSKSVAAKYVLNAAGVFADQIHNMIAEPAFTINPRRGQYFLLDRVEEGIVNSTVFPCPAKTGKGVLVAPTVHGNVLLGPASDDIPDKEDVGTTEEILNKTRAGAKLLVPAITTKNNIRTFAGMRAEPDTGDFIIKEAAHNFIDIAGIKSPGLTAAPAIAFYVISLLREIGLPLREKKNFDPVVKREKPPYGRIVCRCENVTEDEIVDSIKRGPGAVSLDGVKRRCRAGMGRCQSGFCGPKVQQILARELNTPLEDIALDKEGSYILTGKTK
jgi:glycerol-3-phosphate dehydrogenase